MQLQQRLLQLLLLLLVTCISQPTHPCTAAVRSISASGWLPMQLQQRMLMLLMLAITSANTHLHLCRSQHQLLAADAAGSS
jgi:hypothetical protein